MHSIWRCLMLAGLVTLGGRHAPMAAVAPVLVFDGVTVVDVAQGRLLQHQRVVITGTRISAVADARAITVPPGAQIVDARGKYLIPGLWDLHVHPYGGAPNVFYPLLIANGVTGIRDAGSDVPLPTQHQWWREVLAGTQVGPSRQLLAGQPVMGFYVPGGHEGPFIDSLVAAGATALKLYPYTPARARAARRTGLPFGGHVERRSAVEASDSGMRIIDHLDTSGGLDTLCTGPMASVDRCRPVAEVFQRNGTWFVPTLVAGASLGRIPSASRSVFVRLCTMAHRLWTTDSALADNWLQGAIHAPATDSLPFLSQVVGLGIAQRVGLPILAGTDVTLETTGTRPAGFALHVELAMYVAEGMTPLAALQTATLNPARLLHGTDSLGTVAPGKLADLVLLDADPLADITNTTRIRAVVANGRYFDRAALDHLVAQVRAAPATAFARDPQMTTCRRLAENR